MKFIIEIDGKKVLLSAAQVEILTTALAGADAMVDIDVERGNGTYGYANQYIHGVRPYQMQNHLTLRIMDDDEYESLKFITKQHEAKKS